MKPLQKSQQRGMVLVISLIMLLLMTLLAISASTSSSLQERMANNAQEANIAFQAAESALANLTSQMPSPTPAADDLLALVYPDRTVRVRMQSSWQFAPGTSLDAEEGSGTPQVLLYDFTSSATLDQSATTAADIDDTNTIARHLQGYRDRTIQ
jgi:type IV pilus assembly protein PilX